MADETPPVPPPPRSWPPPPRASPQPEANHGEGKTNPGGIASNAYVQRKTRRAAIASGGAATVVATIFQLISTQLAEHKETRVISPSIEARVSALEVNEMQLRIEMGLALNALGVPLWMRPPPPDAGTK